MRGRKMELIVALDVDNLTQAEGLVDKLKGCVEYFKVGSRLFTAEGPAILDLLNRKSVKTFLDLKYHDIPSVIADALRNAAARKVFAVSLHGSGGRQMLEMCRDAKPRPLLWAITVLTSFDQKNLREIGVEGDVPAQVDLLARLARDTGMDGVVSSPQEIPVIKKIGGLQMIVPGIRTEIDEQSDQKRTLTPARAKELGADFIVCGRPIIKAPEPLQVVERILKEIK
ncbi:MAG: orotidine-5'-phosphate decarboxylase [bacterium]|nr:orotidine-5'-phosphate decarboxylase [bacterium]